MTPAEMTRRLKRGEPLASIAADAGVTPERVSQISRELGLPPRRRTLTPEDDQAVDHLVGRGMSDRAIAAELELGRTTVQRIRRRLERGEPRRKHRAM